MTKPLSFSEACDQAAAVGVTLIKYAGSSNAYGSVFRCQLGHEWSAKHNNVVSANRTGCPICYERGRHLTEGDIREKLSACGRELVAIESAIRGQQTKVTVRCPHGHVSTVRLGTVIYAKKQCAGCTRRARKVDLDGINEKLAKQGYRIHQWCRTGETATIHCNCGQSWEARLGSVLREQSHCPACFEKGFDGEKPAVLYLYALRKGRRLRYGYGISGQFPRRDAEHRRNAAEAGWSISLERVWEFERGVLAYEIEKHLKRTLPVPAETMKGFKTEAIMPRHLPSLLATLTNSDRLHSSHAQRHGQRSS